MKTLQLIQNSALQIPMRITWHLSDIGRAQGLQELFTRQSPQKLKILREHAIAQSVVSSNRIEGVEIEQARVGTVVFGHPSLKDRDEEEVAGYRDALNLIHTQGRELPVAEDTILQLHKMSRGEIWDAGQYKDQPVDIIEKLPTGGERVRFRSVIGYVLYILKQAYDEFERRTGDITAPRGEKMDLVLDAIRQQDGPFRLVDLEAACPGVGRDWIRRILFNLKAQGSVRCMGKGRAAKWAYTGD